MNHVREVPHRRAHPHREHQLAEDLARPRRNQRGAHQHAALAVGDQLDRAAVEVVDVTARRLGRVRGRDHNLEAPLMSAGLCQTHRSHLRIRESDARHSAVIRARVLTAQSPCDHLAVVVREMREPAEPGDVAGAVNAVVRLERQGIHLQPSALGLREARLAPGLEVRAPAGGYQQPVSLEDRSRLEAHHHSHAVRLHRHAWIADEKLDAVLLQMRPQRGARLGLFEAEKARSCLDHRDLRSQACVCLRQLDAHRTASQHDERAGQLVRDSRLPVRPVLHLVQAGDLRDDGGAPVRDHHRLAGMQLLAAHLDRVKVQQLANAADQLGAGRLQRGCGFGVIEIPSHPQHSLGDLRKVDHPVHTRCGQRASAAGFRQGLARTQQRLRRHAAPVRALAAHQLALDHHQRKTASAQPGCEGFARHAAPKTDDVKFLCQPAHLLEGLRPSVIPEANSL